MFILDVFEEQKTKEDVKELLKKYGCNFLKEEEMGIKKLAYKIKKRENAFYYLAEVELDPSTLKDINNDVKLNEKVLKYMTTIIKDKKLSKKKKKKEIKNDPSEKHTNIETDKTK